MADSVRLPQGVVERFRRFSLYNSPYTAHDRGCGIDLYPPSNRGVAPVAGEVLDTRSVQCPSQPYATDRDHLIVIDTGDHLARVLHVEPAVEAGDRVAVGDPLGHTVRSGFFGPWVDDHVHLEFRRPDANPYRATGSLPITLDTPIDGVAWDGTGRVVETGRTYAVLDSPAHPDPGRYVSLASDEGVPLDGGLTHYTGGGRLDLADAPEAPTTSAPTELSLLGTTVASTPGRTLTWEPIDVVANGERITGLSLFASREAGFGVKLVSRPSAGQPSFELGESVEVTVRPSESPIRLG